MRSTYCVLLTALTLILLCGCPPNTPADDTFRVSPISLRLNVGQSTSLSASSPVADDIFTWTSADTGVATVNDSGEVSAVGAGSTRISVASSKTGRVASASVMVPGAAVAGQQVSISPEAATILVGDSVALVASTTRPGGTLTWHSADESIATVDSDGVVVGLQPGTVDITAQGAAPEERASASITVVEAPIPQAVVRPPGASILVGETFALSATADDPNETFAWASQDASIASIDADGVVTGVAAGVVRISATGINSGATGLTMIAVEEQDFIQVTVSPVAAIVAAGETISLSGSTTRLGGGITWSSGDETIAAVDQDGIVTGNRPGTIAITATGDSPDERSSSLVTVVEPTAPAALLRPSGARIVVGDTVALTADSGDPSESFTWTSGDDSIATIAENGVVTAVSAGTVTIATVGATTGATGSATITVAEPLAHRVTVAPATATLAVADSIQLQPSTTRGEDTFTWSSADESVATVSDTGLVVGVGVGSVAITTQGSRPGESGASFITVIAPVEKVVSIRPLAASVAAGGQVALQATSTDASDTITWTTGSEAVATVDAAGIVSGHTAGTAVITAAGSNSGETDAATITVTTAVAHQVRVAPEAAGMFTGDTLQLTASTSRPGGTLTWSSDDTSIATVGSAGLVTAVGSGATTIVVQGALPDERAEVAVTVSDVPVPAIKVRPLGASITAGSSIALTAVSADETDQFVWTSEDTSVATVSAAGVVTGVEPGTARINVSGTSSGAAGSTTIIVTASVVHRVTASPSSATVFTGDTVQLTGSTTRTGDPLTWSSSVPSVATVDTTGRVHAVGIGASTITVQGSDPDERAVSTITVIQKAAATAMVRPLGASIEAGAMVSLIAASSDASESFTWSSSDTSIATVDANGVVTGFSEGTAIITAAGVNTGAEGRATIEVTPGTSTITIAPGSTAIAVGGEVALVAASGLPSDQFSWSTSNDTIAAVDADGVVTGVAPGTANIRATGTVSGAEGVAVVTVTDDAVHEVNVTPVAPVIFVSDTVELTAASSDPDDTFTWVSGDTSIASVNASGVVTGVKPGTVSITAQGRNSGIGASAMVTVNAHTVIMDTITATVVVANSVQLSAQSTDVDDDFAWVSADPSVATVDATGKVTGVTSGTTVITVRGTRSGVTATCEVAVRDGVAVNPAVAKVAEGKTRQLVAQSTDRTESFAWTSTNPAVAMVSASGLVTGVRVGSATITATGARTGESASATITVVPALVVSPAVASTTIGRIASLSATSADIEDSFTWTSSDPAIATVTGGIVTGVSVGTVRITCTADHSGAVGFADVEILPEFPNALLFDGEDFTTSARALKNTVEQFRGFGCLEGVPTQWAGYAVTLSHEFYRADISKYDEIWMMVKAHGSGANSLMSLSSYLGESDAVEIASYAPGGVIGSKYQLIRIPIADLVNETYDLTRNEWIRFGKRKASESFRLFIDEIWAVNLDSVDANGGPLTGMLPALDFALTSVAAPETREVSVHNSGGSPLGVTGVTIAGAGASAYSVTPSQFTIAPGANAVVTVAFAPSMAGAYDATVEFNHGMTAFGRSTSMPVSGVGAASQLRLSRESLDFGGVPLSNTVVQTLTITNTGNEPLSISNIQAPAGFGADRGSLSVQPGESGVVAITTAPLSTGVLAGNLTFSTNAPGNSSVSIPLQTQGLAASAVGTLPLQSERVTSSTVTVDWGQWPLADSIRVAIGPEPPASAGARLPLEYEVATLPGNASVYTIDGLAAGVTAFVRVEASVLGVPLAARNIAVQMPGGPGADLDGKLREVHLFAPNIIQVVLSDLRVHSFREDSNTYDSGIDEVIGNTGAAWQAGPWTVRRADGSEIAVQNVYRHSIPVGAPYYDIGYGTATNDHLLDMDHRIYLVLAENVGSPEVLQVTGPSFTYDILRPDLEREARSASLDVLVPFSDRYMTTPAIQVNQVGYSPAATQRYAYVSGWIGDGGPLDLSGYPAKADVIIAPESLIRPRRAALTGLPISLRSELDEDAGTEVRDIDIAALPESDEAIYHVRIPGVGISWPTKVNELAVFESFYHVARGLYHNRWAGDLAPEYTDWSRPADHGLAYTAEASGGFYHPDTPRIGERPIIGGHHDAGDFDLRIFHSVVAQMLMRAYEMNASAFTDGQLIFPESGNGIPDFLDEALWSIAAWEDLQEADGGVRTGAESWRHPWGIYPAHEDPLPFWTYRRDPAFSARCAGLFAQASRLVAPFDSNRARELKGRALAAYDYAQASALPDTIGGPLAYATSELYLLTGSDEFRDKFIQAWDANASAYPPFAPSIFSRDNPWATSFSSPKQPFVWDHVSGYFVNSGADAGHVSHLDTLLEREVDTLIERFETSHAHRNGRPAGYALAFGKGTAVGQYLFGGYAAMQLADLDAQSYQEMFDLMSLSADYMLGCNPIGMSWITGLGSRSPRYPLHLDSLVAIKAGQGPVPGIPVYGLTESLRQQTYYTYGTRLAYPAYPDSPQGLRYGDVHTFVISNEFTVWEDQAPTAQLFGLLIAPGMTPPDAWLPAARKQ